MLCEEKTQYRDEAEAMRVLHMARKQPNRGPALRRLDAYLCPTCELWHIGHHAARMKPPTPAEQKPPTPGAQRRKANMMQNRSSGQQAAKRAKR